VFFSFSFSEASPRKGESMMWSLLAVVSALQQNLSVSPVQKVVQLLQNMQATATEEMQNEEVSFAAFKTFCDGTLKRKAGEIAEENDQIEALQASIQKNVADADGFAQRASQISQEVTAHEQNLKEQKEERAAEKEEYAATHRDLSESVDALGRAISVLQKQQYDRKQQGDALIQLATVLPEAQQLVENFFQDDGDFLSRAAPEANAYEAKSGGIVEMLEKLEDEFKTKLSDAEKAEMNSQHAFEMAVQDLTDAVKQGKEEVEEAAAAKSQKEGAAAENRKDLVATTEDRDNDQVYRKDLKAECSQKTLSFEEKQKLRKDEIAAVQQAITILSSPEVAGNEEKHRALAQTSFMQLVRPHAAGRAVDFLVNEGQRLNNQPLSLLAQRLLAAGPFDKVTKMIENMITRLLDEANEEAQEKGFCDKELGTNQQTRDKLSGEMEKLAAVFDQSTATSQTLSSKISALENSINEMKTAVADATQQREEEKDKNTSTVKDAKEAQKAVAAAVQVLREFYEKAATATGFLFLQYPSLLAKHIKMGSDEWQSLANPAFEGEGGYGQGSEDKVDSGHKEGMQTFGDSYQGQQDKASGVLSMLEIIMSDFASVQSDTETQEAEAQRQFEQFVTDSKRDQAVKARTIELYQADRTEADARAKEAKRDLLTTDDKHKAAVRYYEELKPRCLEKGIVSFEKRQQQRQEEIDSLKQALAILSQDRV